MNDIATPDAAYLFLIVAVGFLSLWFAHPAGVPMLVVSGLAAVGAWISFSNLPIDYTGLVLLGVAFILFLMDIAATTHGLLTALGAIAMSLGGWLVVDTSTIDNGVSLVMVALSVFSVVGAYSLLIPKLVAVRRLPHSDFATQLIGQVATVRETLHPEGMVMVEGALWNATATRGPVQAGDSVRVTSVDGLKLTVEVVGQTNSATADTP